MQEVEAFIIFDFQSCCFSTKLWSFCISFHMLTSRAFKLLICHLNAVFQSCKCMLTDHEVSHCLDSVAQVVYYCRYTLTILLMLFLSCNGCRKYWTVQDSLLQMLRSIRWEILLQLLKKLLGQHLKWFARVVLCRNFESASTKTSRFITFLRESTRLH